MPSDGRRHDHSDRHQAVITSIVSVLIIEGLNTASVNALDNVSLAPTVSSCVHSSSLAAAGA